MQDNLMKYIPILFTLLLLLCLSGCVKAITVDPGPYEEKIAIEGLLLPGEVATIYVNKTVPFFATETSPSDLFLPDAEVVLTSSTGVEQLVADSLYNKFWCRWEPFYRGSKIVQQDEEYQLSIVWRNRSYTASTVTNVPAVQIKSTDYVESFTDIYGGHEGVIVDFDDIPGQNNQYRFQMDRPLTNVHETVDDFEVRSDCLSDGETFVVHEYSRFVYFDDGVDGAPVRFAVEPAYTHYKNDTATLYIQSLNKEVADYYDVLDRQREANINPFIEPVFLKNQIEGAVGVFGAINRSEPVSYVFPIDAG